MSAPTSSLAPTPEVVSVPMLPDPPSAAYIYRLPPVNASDVFYADRTDRNIGWVTPAEQNKILRSSVVGVAGCGGMGGILAQTFVRLGIGEVRIADSETFDVSNINRQFASGRYAVGRSKAFETAKMIRWITDDSTLVVYPQGIQENTVAHFLDGCDVVCDEIEFWALGARILLHQEARARGIPVFNCNSVGFGSRLFYFQPGGYTMEQVLGFSYQEARSLQERIQSRKATKQEITTAMNAVLVGLVPEIPEYGIAPYSTEKLVFQRLFEEMKAMIIGTNPLMAAGFLGNHVLLDLLEKKSNVGRCLEPLVSAPGYIYLDAALRTMKDVMRTEVVHER